MSRGRRHPVVVNSEATEGLRRIVRLHSRLCPTSKGLEVVKGSLFGVVFVPKGHPLLGGHVPVPSILLPGVNSRRNALLDAEALAFVNHLLNELLVLLHVSIPGPVVFHDVVPVDIRLGVVLPQESDCVSHLLGGVASVLGTDGGRHSLDAGFPCCPDVGGGHRIDTVPFPGDN